MLSTIYRDTTFTATKGKYGSVEDGQKDLQSVEGKEFTVTDISTKKGTEAPPRLYDLTSLQKGTGYQPSDQNIRQETQRQKNDETERRSPA